MNPHIRIVRYPYEEPHHLRLVMSASNGAVAGRLEFYVNGTALLEWADGIERFAARPDCEKAWELGSERAEDRFAFYFRLRLFAVDRFGNCAIQLRFNNNAAPPDGEVSEFCIRTESAQINRLSRLCREFAKLRDEVLDWSLTDGHLYESMHEVPTERQPL